MILTWRTAENWWDSIERTLLPVILQSKDKNTFANAIVNARSFDGRAGEREYAIIKYEENVETVKNRVPAGRLLIHELGDGWEPLCAHLGVSIPDEPYPQTNKKSGFKSHYIENRVEES